MNKASRKPNPSASDTTPPSAGAIEAKPSLLRIQHLLVPVDFSEPCRKALRYAVQVAEKFGAKLTLLHVVEPVGSPDFAYFPLAADSGRVLRAAQAQMRLLCRREAIPPSMLASAQVREGKPYQRIAEAARSMNVDLIIIATHGYTGLDHVILGSTTERVVRHAPCPVLVVRQDKAVSA
jgi:universal stress protein A